MAPSAMPLNGYAAVTPYLVRPIEDKPYGDRMGTFADPFGYEWHIATPLPVKSV
jgi:uncharacterized glyoxalase superfamily protein PhnB